MQPAVSLTFSTPEVAAAFFAALGAGVKVAPIPDLARIEPAHNPEQKAIVSEAATTQAEPEPETDDAPKPRRGRPPKTGKKEIEPSADAAPEAATTQAEPEPATYDAVRKALFAKAVKTVQAGDVKADDVVALLAEYKVSTIAKLADEQVGPFAAAFDALVAGA